MNTTDEMSGSLILADETIRRHRTIATYCDPHMIRSNEIHVSLDCEVDLQSVPNKPRPVRKKRPANQNPGSRPPSAAKQVTVSLHQPATSENGKRYSTSITQSMLPFISL